MNSPEFEKLLADAFPTWESDASPNPGLLKVEMTGTGFLGRLEEEKAHEIIKLMKKHLPADTSFYWPASVRRLVMWEGTNGTGSDLFYLIFASKEWEPVKEGENLPTFTLNSSWL